MILRDSCPSDNHFNVSDTKECCSGISNILFILAEGYGFTYVYNCLIQGSSIAPTTVECRALDNEYPIRILLH